MLRIVAGLVLLALGAGVVEAQNTAVIKQRQDLMKANAEALKAPAAMLKGDAPFDLAKVQASLKALQEQSAKVKPLWTEDTKTGGDTRALPAVWKDLKGYLGRFDTMATSAKAAAAAIKDEASFKTAFPKVLGSCGGCHKEYRAAAK
jgi:cytochrome c556